VPTRRFHERKVVNRSTASPDFTGEFFVPGKSGSRIEADHVERYRFACGFARDKSVLDIACGVGYSAPLFVEAGAARYDGVDIREDLVEYAGRTHGGDRVRFFVGDISTFTSATAYDVIACFETVEHVEDYESALRNLHALLKPGGVLLLSSPNRRVTSPGARSVQDPPENEFHRREFTPEELVSDLRDAGFMAGEGDIYGQRQRHVPASRLLRGIYKQRLLRRLVYSVFGNPDVTTSPVVAPVTDKAPRYFIVVATKK
jgi:SAM-dependent methyltransferase